MALTTTPTDYANLCTGRLAAKISTTTATGIAVTADTFVTPAGTGATTWPTGPQIWKVSRKTRTGTEVEFIGVETLSQTGTAITTGTVNRYLPANGSSLTSQGNGLTFPAGSIVELVWHAFAAEKVAYQDIANTFSANQTISSTNELRFASSATAIWKDGSNLLSFKDASNGTKTLSDLSAASGADEKAKVSSNDTTQGYLNGKLVAGDGITLTENSDGGNETLSVIASNTVATGHTGLSTVTTGGLLIGAGTSNMTIIGPGTSGQVPVSNGTTLAMGTASTYFKNYKSTTNLLASKDAVGNTVSETAFTTTYTIPANFFLATGDAMLVNLFGYTQSKGASAGTITLKLKFGSTVISTLMSSTMTDNTEQPWSSDLRIVCATQGASGKLYVDSYVRYEGSSTKDYYTHAYDSNNSSLGISFDTTASASLTVTCQFSVADVANYCVLDWMNINKISTTAF